MAVSNEVLLEALDAIISTYPDGGEIRPGQREMVIEVNENLRRKDSLTAEAGTGIGKSLAYLLPYVLGKERVVVATYTKALQDQLIDNDLPRIADYLLNAKGQKLDYQIMKGWSNYLCNYKLDKHRSGNEETQILLDLGIARTPVNRIIEWINAYPKKASREDIEFGIDQKTWEEVSMTSQDCLKDDCPSWSNCYPRDAREKAKEADVIVTNHAMYAFHIEFGILGHIGRVIIDEAHQAEEAFSSALSTVLSPRRFRWLATHSKRILGFAGREVNVEKIETELKDAGEQLHVALSLYEPVRIYSGEAAGIANLLSLTLPKIESLITAVSGINTASENLEVLAEKKRILNAAKNLLRDSTIAFSATKGDISDKFVAFIDQTDGGQNSLTISPLSIKDKLSEHWSGTQDERFDVSESISKSVLMTSATIPDNLSERMGLPSLRTKKVAFSSPFDYQSNALLYCPKINSPVRDSEDWEDDVFEELENLISISGGKTLALFTSKSMLNRAHQYIQRETDLKILKQGERPPKDLLREFKENEEVSLFATRMFFQGIDVPGTSLSLVVVNRLPFPSPIEHLIQAWWEKQEAEDMKGFKKILLPICKVRLAQAGGRLIRRMDDTGVVAVLDPRLADTDYGSFLLEGFPPMRRTREFDVVEEFFTQIT